MTRQVRYLVIVEKGETQGFIAHAPELPGCYSQGQTVGETLENMRGSMEAWLEAARDLDIPVVGETV
jgi:predicted RNase H-like HicB family nuclease